MAIQQVPLSEQAHLKWGGMRLFDKQRLGIVSWVSREVLPHEADVRRWLRRMANVPDAEDVIQEAYCRISNLSDVRHIKNGRAREIDRDARISSARDKKNRSGKRFRTDTKSSER